MNDSDNATTEKAVDHSSKKEFVDYYARESANERTLQRFTGIQNLILQAMRQEGKGTEEKYVVADIGCGAGVQSILWARQGHQVLGLDVNAPLLELAKQRAKDEDLDIHFELGSAEDLPWPDNMVDICILPELLEHVVNWEQCLDEAARIVKKGGLLFLSTTNKLCPVQQEFDLPLYSWYPGFLKRRYEKLAVTSRPELVSHATYPAVNWFTNYSLAKELNKRGFRARDKFAIKAQYATPGFKERVFGLVDSFKVLRLVANVMTPYSQLCGIKE